MMKIIVQLCKYVFLQEPFIYETLSVLLEGHYNLAACERLT